MDLLKIVATAFSQQLCKLGMSKKIADKISAIIWLVLFCVVVWALFFKINDGGGLTTKGDQSPIFSNDGDVSVKDSFNKNYNSRYSATQTINGVGLAEKVRLNLDNSGILRVHPMIKPDIYEITLVLNPETAYYTNEDQITVEFHDYENSKLYTFYTNSHDGPKNHLVESNGRTFLVTLLSVSTPEREIFEKVKYQFSVVEQ